MSDGFYFFIYLVNQVIKGFGLVQSTELSKFIVRWLSVISTTLQVYAWQVDMLMSVRYSDRELTNLYK